jgi:hypothetical protein
LVGNASVRKLITIVIVINNIVILSHCVASKLCSTARPCIPLFPQPSYRIASHCLSVVLLFHLFPKCRCK